MTVLSPDAMLDAFKACVSEAGYPELADNASLDKRADGTLVPRTYGDDGPDCRAQLAVTLRAWLLVGAAERPPGWCALCCLDNNGNCDHDEGKSWDAWRAELLGDTP